MKNRPTDANETALLKGDRPHGPFRVNAGEGSARRRDDALLPPVQRLSEDKVGTLTVEPSLLPSELSNRNDAPPSAILFDDSDEHRCESYVAEPERAGRGRQ